MGSLIVIVVVMSLTGMITTLAVALALSDNKTKTIVPTKTGDIYICKCGNAIYEIDKYCPECGCKLKW